MTKKNSVAAVQIGKVLRQKREELGLSRGRVAVAADLEPNTLYMIERGLRLPMADTLAKLAKVLGLSDWTLDQFLDYQWVEKEGSTIPEMVLQLVNASGEAMRTLLNSLPDQPLRRAG